MKERSGATRVRWSVIFALQHTVGKDGSEHPQGLDREPSGCRIAEDSAVMSLTARVVWMQSGWWDLPSFTAEGPPHWFCRSRFGLALAQATFTLSSVSG